MIRKTAKSRMKVGGKNSEPMAADSIAERRKTVGKYLSFGASEAYKLLRTNVIFSMSDENICKVVGVTSALRGEGKSTTSINLAYTLAESGKKVLLVEADMRLPIMSSVFRIKDVPGLSHVLAGINRLNDAVRPSDLIRDMYVLPAGEIPPNPSELLSSRRMEQVLEALALAFEYIVIDLPPVNAVSDGLAISKFLSGMIVVVRKDYCDQISLAEAMRRMELLEVKLLGFVLNDAESDEKKYKKYGLNNRHGKTYGYYYGNRKKTKDVLDSENDNKDIIILNELEIKKESGQDV